MTRYTKENAIDVLSRYKHQGEKMLGRDFWIALRDGKLPEFYSEVFTHYRFERSDECPDIDVRRLPKEREFSHIFKCQIHTVMGICSNLWEAIEQGVITSPTLIEEIEAFLASDLEFSVGDPKNEDRIKRINSVLDKALAYLQKTYGIAPKKSTDYWDILRGKK